MITPDQLNWAVWDVDNKGTIAVAAVSARLASDLPVGVYYIISTTNCWFKQGDSTVAAVVGTSNYLPANMAVMMEVAGASTARVAAIRASADGTFIVMQPRAK